MKHRKLRIAWSVAWGLLAVLLCVLFVRSYWRWDYVGGPNILADSYLGRFGASFFFIDEISDGWYFDPGHIPGFLRDDARLKASFQGRVSLTDLEFTVPHWFAATLFAAVAVIPWLRWSKRFSLRTLLIATTLIAVALGIIVWMSRAG